MKKVIPIAALLIATACRSEEAAPPVMPRTIVRSANVKIVVGDTSRTVGAVSRTVESAGGYVSGSNMWRDGELLRAKLTLRVPADKLTSTLASIRAQAKRVENETITETELLE